MRTSAGIVAFIALLIHAAHASSPARAPGGLRSITFSEHSPLSTREIVDARLGALKPPAPLPPPWRENLDLATEPFDVYIAPAFKPDTPVGIFVWMGVVDAPPEWMDVLARHKLIFLDPKLRYEKTENGHLRKALDGVFNLKERYTIDENRVFISGFSGGASEASFSIVAFPDVFRGAVFFMGGGFYFTHPDGDAPQTRRVASSDSRSPWRGDLDRIRRNFPLVIVTGQNDANDKGQSLAQYEGLVNDGFVRATFMKLSGLGHQLPGAGPFEKAINALDHPELKKPPTTSPTKDAHPSAAQQMYAKRMISLAETFKEFPVKWRPADEWRRVLRKVLSDYPTTPAAKTAREMLGAVSDPATQP